MGAGVTGAGTSIGRGSRVGTIGFAMSLIGWVVLAVSLFLERGDSLVPGITTERMIEFQPIGILLVFLLALILPSILFARRLPGNFIWLLAGLWLMASALTIFAGFHLDAVGITSTGNPGFVGVVSSDPGPGTYMSIIGANLGFVGTGLMAWSRRDP
jgi:hypothetical protein